jgi:hypothetical protein
LLVAVGVASVCVACVDRRVLVAGGGNDGAPPDAPPDTVAGDGGVDVGIDSLCRARYLTDPANPFSPTLLPECLDGIDNDGDGLIDYADPDCTGVFDNDEWSFAIRTGTDEEDDPCKRDCFFDSNSGSGDDMCLDQLPCDPLSPGAVLGQCPYRADAVCPAVTDVCLATCLPKTANGCDCFGCCAVVRDGVSTTVLLSIRCDSQHLDDPSLCVPCTQQPSCLNPCETCEVCFGKPRPDPGCWPDGTSHDLAPPGQCPPGVTACGPGGVDPCACPAGTFCVTGCCVPDR